MHPETQYVLDCAMEFGELTPLEYTLAFCSPKLLGQIDAGIAGGGMAPDFLGSTTRAALQLASHELKMALALQAMPAAPNAFTLLVDRINLVVRNKVLRDLGECEGGFLQFIGEDLDDEKIFNSFSEVLPHSVQQVVDTRFGWLLSRWLDDLEVMEQAQIWFASGNTDARKARALELLHPGQQETFHGMVAMARPRSLDAKSKRSARSAIKKVVKLFERTHRLDSVKALVSGKEVVISHPDSAYKFVIVPYRADWLERASVTAAKHPPFNIRLFTKTDVHLANLCVYFADTPVLDQLFALMMYIQSGEETQVLRTANWFGVDDVPRVIDELRRGNTEELVSRVMRNVDGPSSEDFERMLPSDHRKWEPYEGPVTQWLRGMLLPPRLTHLVNTVPTPMPLAA